jgi:hypothetical protein
MAMAMATATTTTTTTTTTAMAMKLDSLWFFLQRNLFFEIQRKRKFGRKNAQQISE